MSARNKKLVMNFMEGYTTGNTLDCSRFLSDDIKWNIVGMPAIKGKQNFLQAMETMELWRSSLKHNDTMPVGTKNIIAEKDLVVVESSGINNSSSYCDIYKILNGRIREMTSYIVDTTVKE